MDTEIASCMACRKELSLSFVEENTPKCFYKKEYTNKRVDVILSLEKSLLPATQDLFKIAKQRLISVKLAYDITQEMEVLYKEKQVIQNRITNLITKRSKIYREMELSKNSVDMNDIIDKQVYTNKCGVDDCRGYYNQAWVCGTCESKACSKCQIVLPKDSKKKHKCNKDDLKTVKFLKKDTKQCPKCTVRIHKINGCDQMFCMECKTAFSWKTGKIEKGRIHNPHYYQWQRDGNNGVAPRVPGDVPVCGELPWITVLQAILIGKQQQFKNLENCHRLSAHLRATVLRNLVEEPTENRYARLRVEYLMKDIDEKIWHKELKKHNKKLEKQRELRNVVEMFVNSLDDTMHAFSRKRIPNLSKACHALRGYVNKQLGSIDRRYNTKSVYIELNWTVTGKRELIF